MPSRHERYLRKRGIKGPWKLEGRTAGEFQTVVVIPALAEREALPQTLASLAKNPAAFLRQTLVIIVVNQRQNTSVHEKDENRLLLSWLGSEPFPNLNVAWVDACREGCEFSLRDGVGLARKIGADLALSYLDWTQDPMLVSLDADTLVDVNYLPALRTHFSRSSCVGAWLPYLHQPGASPAEEVAIRRYELYLRSYQLGLELAGSPYAGTAIGSAIACRAGAYIAAGGMKRRQAGEDFYFLQQLFKLGSVDALEGTLVRPSARFSDRVPFGTGRAIEKQVKEGQTVFRFISWQSFSRLKVCLEEVAACSGEGGEEVFARLQERDPGLGEFLAELDFVPNWEKLQRSTPPAQFLRAWHNWFDGLRTRQFLHRCELEQTEADPACLVAELLKQSGFDHIADETRQLRILERLQHVPGHTKESI